MNLGSFKQQPSEKLDYDLNYVNWLTENDGIATLALTVEPSGTLAVTGYVTSPRIKIWADGGTSGVSYKITATIETDDGRRKQDEFTIKVKEV